jgi:hypothetical protein
MKYDLTKAMKAPNTYLFWGRMIHLHDEMRERVQSKVTYTVATMLMEEETRSAIRSMMKVSNRVDPSLRNAFDYLKGTYTSAVEHGQPEGDWTYRMRMFPIGKTVYIVIEQGMVVADLNEMFVSAIPGVVPYGYPVKHEAHSRRSKVWESVLAQTDTHFQLDVCTPENFEGYASHAVDSMFSK